MCKLRTAFLCLPALLILLMAGSALQVYAEDYQYKITIEDGLYGKAAVHEVTLALNERWNPNDYPVTVMNDKYYFKGFHISGIEGIVGSTEITQDMVFTAAYGVRGSTVPYTVRYQDAAGRQLRETRTYYGNEGDKPVAACLYVEGYMPRYYNITRTLHKDGGNEFVFIYDRTAAGQADSGSTRTAAGMRHTGEMLDLDTAEQTAVQTEQVRRTGEGTAVRQEDLRRYTAMTEAVLSALCIAGLAVLAFFFGSNGRKRHRS